MATSSDAPKKDEDFFGLVGNVFKMYKDSWEALKLNLVTFIILALIPAILLAVAVPFILLPFVTDGGSLSSILSFVVLLALFVIACIFLPALVVTQLESAKGNKIDINQVVERSKPLVLPYIGLAIVLAVIFTIGFILLVIPGIIAVFFLSLSVYILVDKKVGVFDSIKQSYELTKANWQWVLALFIVQFAVSLVSYLPLIGWLLGIVLSIVYFCLPAIVYLKIVKK